MASAGSVLIHPYTTRCGDSLLPEQSWLDSSDSAELYIWRHVGVLTIADREFTIAFILIRRKIYFETKE